MYRNPKRSHGADATATNAERHAGACAPMLSTRFYLDERDDVCRDARAEIDNAMKSVGLVLETALEAMENLRNVRDALTPHDNAPGATCVGGCTRPDASGQPKHRRCAGLLRYAKRLASSWWHIGR